MTKIKICGITDPDDARAAVEAGADAIGINLVPSSSRYVTRAAVREIARAIPGAMLVAVVADMPLSEMLELRSEFACLQLHGQESPEALAALLPHAYKALRIASETDVATAALYPGDHLLVDAKVPGALGGTGTSFDWSLVKELARVRKLTLAGGLRPDNVRDAIWFVRPYAVDVSSGVECAGNPRRKDVARIRHFVGEAKAADEQAKAADEQTE